MELLIQLHHELMWVLNSYHSFCWYLGHSLSVGHTYRNKPIKNHPGVVFKRSFPCFSHLLVIFHTCVSYTFPLPFFCVVYAWLNIILIAKWSYSQRSVKLWVVRHICPSNKATTSFLGGFSIGGVSYLWMIWKLLCLCKNWTPQYSK